MSLDALRIRRATTEDLAPLMALWASMRYPAEDLAKRVTDFQVVEGGQKEIIGAVALDIVQRQGRVHSEGFTDFAVAEYARPLLWDRLQSVAQNHGLLRLWCQEEAPFWNHCGMLPPEPPAIAVLPGQWKHLPGRWLTLKLREDLDTILTVDREFAAFMQAEKAQTTRAIEHARIFKFVATLLASAVLIGVLVAAFYLVRHAPALGGR